MFRNILGNRFIGPLLLVLVIIFFIVELLGYGFFDHLFLPGKSSSAHHQIETACSACHAPLGGVKQDTCIDCHGDELKAVDDSHAIKIFNDPRSFSLLAQINAKKCVTCHVEHIAEETGDKVASVPNDFCYTCHEDITTERASHKDFSADGCNASGCHNYHDNRALYEDFVAKHLDEAELLETPQVPQRDFAVIYAQKSKKPIEVLISTDQDSKQSALDTEIIKDWASSGHAHSGVNCTDCHEVEDKSEKAGSTGKIWTDHPQMAACIKCHAQESETFLQGKHGMRISSGLSPMVPSLARQPMKAKAHDKQLTCNSCHKPHRRDIQQAAVKACLGCHIDEHSKAYIDSPHHQLWKQEVSGSLPPGSGVSCATCHLPRIAQKKSGIEQIFVMHNQNFNLSPNSKMIRSVCMNCHGFAFSLDALADPDLMLNNYASSPTEKIDTVEMVRQRKLKKKPASRSK